MISIPADMAVTHYVPYFTAIHAGRLRLVSAVCGQAVTFPRDHSVTPDCPQCAAWLAADDAEAAVLAARWDAEDTHTTQKAGD